MDEQTVGAGLGWGHCDVGRVGGIGQFQITCSGFLNMLSLFCNRMKRLGGVLRLFVPLKFSRTDPFLVDFSIGSSFMGGYLLIRSPPRIRRSVGVRGLRHE